MISEFKHMPYENLNSRQRENYNFHKLAAQLAEYGFNALRLSDDWQGADLIACHIDGNTFLKVQLKGRFCIDKKYIGKDIYIAFRKDDDWYLYPHDELSKFVDQADKVNGSISWSENQSYSWPSPPKWALDELAKHKLIPRD